MVISSFRSSSEACSPGRGLRLGARWLLWTMPVDASLHSGTRAAITRQEGAVQQRDCKTAEMKFMLAPSSTSGCFTKS